MKTLVMQGRRRWMIGADIGLSRAYLFIGGDIVAVPDEDAAILLDPKKTGDHVFLEAHTDEAAAVLAEAEARAVEKAKGWKSPGKCCDDDVVGEVDEGETIPGVAVETAADPGVGAKAGGFIEAAGIPTGGAAVGKVSAPTYSPGKR